MRIIGLYFPPQAARVLSPGRIETRALRLRQVLAREVIARCGTRRQPPFLYAPPPDLVLDTQRGIAVGDESFTGNERGSIAGGD
jgi:hypothetical protein